MKIVKSVGAIFAGFLTVVILSVGTDTVLETLHIFPPIGEGLFNTTLLLAAFVYRSIFTIAGGYVAASMAPDRPMRHATILAVIGTIVGTAGVFIGWDLSSHWYPIALAVTAFPLTWSGGWFKTKKNSD